jgi:hypothetical protein
MTAERFPVTDFAARQAEVKRRRSLEVIPEIKMIEPPPIR